MSTIIRGLAISHTVFPDQHLVRSDEIQRHIYTELRKMSQVHRNPPDLRQNQGDLPAKSEKGTTGPEKKEPAKELITGPNGLPLGVRERYNIDTDPKWKIFNEIDKQKKP